MVTTSFIIHYLDWQDHKGLREGEEACTSRSRIGGVYVSLAACTELVIYGVTRNTTLLLSVPPGVFTSTVPVVLISELETTLNVAAVPLKLTPVAPVRLVPQNLDSRSHLAGGRQSFHKRPRPTQAKDRAIFGTQASGLRLQANLQAEGVPNTA
jgi:hypothetical protein